MPAIESLDHYTQLDRQPARWRAGTNLGQILLTMGRPAEAVEPLQRSLAANPGSGRGHGLLVIALTLTGRHDEASRAIDEAVCESAEFSKGLVPLARTALSLKLPRLAATVVSRARALGEPIPDDVAAGVAQPQRP